VAADSATIFREKSVRENQISFEVELSQTAFSSNAWQIMSGKMSAIPRRLSLASRCLELDYPDPFNFKSHNDTK
jgi:hypothetical protein